MVGLCFGEAVHDFLDVVDPTAENDGLAESASPLFFHLVANLLDRRLQEQGVVDVRAGNLSAPFLEHLLDQTSQLLHGDVVRQEVVLHPCQPLVVLERLGQRVGEHGRSEDLIRVQSVHPFVGRRHSEEEGSLKTVELAGVGVRRRVM